MIARALPPARCPGCGAGVAWALYADPDTPVYHCGSTPTRITCAATPPPPELPNLVPLDEFDTIALGDLAALLSVAWTPSLAPVIGLCEVAGCDATAIDGRCLIH